MDIEAKLQEKVEKKRTEGVRVKKPFVFDYRFVPEKPVWRSEMDPLLESIAEYATTGLTDHTILTGGRGSGKTVFMQFLEKILPQRFGCTVLYANCRVLNSTFKVLAHFLGLTPRGYAQCDFYQKFKERFPDRTIVILDEADYISRELDPQKEILYFLTRDTGCMLIALSNNKVFVDTLDQSILSSLQPALVDFAPYSPETLVEILRQRAQLGLTEMPPEESVLFPLAGLTHVECNADARVAIRALRIWAMRPDTPVKSCFQKAKEQIFQDALKSLNAHQLTILKVIAHAPGQPAKELHQRYVHLFRETYGPERVYRYPTFLATLNLLWNNGLIMLSPVKVNRSNTSQAELMFDKAILEKHFMAQAR